MTDLFLSVSGAYIEVASIARRKGGGPNIVGGGVYADPLMGFGGGRGEPRMTERRMDGAYSALEDDHMASSTGYIVSFFRVFPGELSARPVPLFPATRYATITCIAH